MKKILFGFILGLLLRLSSFSMTIVFYLAVMSFDEFWGLPMLICRLIVVVASLLMCWFLSQICIYMLRRKASNDSADIAELNPHEPQMVPAFVGMFVVSLGLADMPMASVITAEALMFFFWYALCHTSYYNPFFTLSGYRFYEARLVGEEARFIILITKKDGLKTGMKMRKLKRINNYTFMELV